MSRNYPRPGIPYITVYPEGKNTCKAILFFFNIEGLYILAVILLKPYQYLKEKIKDFI